MNKIKIKFANKKYNLEMTERDKLVFEISTGEKFSRENLSNYSKSSKITLLMISLLNSNLDIPTEELLKVGIEGHKNMKDINSALKRLF